MRPVKVLQANGAAVLVEWRDGDMPCRAYLPAGVVVAGTVADEELARGITYGVEWQDEIKLAATAHDLQRNLRGANIWTASDATAHAVVVQSVIQKTYGIDLAAVLTVARQQLRRA